MKRKYTLPQVEIITMANKLMQGMSGGAVQKATPDDDHNTGSEIGDGGESDGSDLNLAKQHAAGTWGTWNTGWE